MAVDAKQRRAELRNQSRCRFVEVEEFLACATSRTRFERADDHLAKLLGLRDPSSGDVIFVEAEKLISGSV